MGHSFAPMRLAARNHAIQMPSSALDSLPTPPYAARAQRLRGRAPLVDSVRALASWLPCGACRRSLLCTLLYSLAAFVVVIDERACLIFYPAYGARFLRMGQEGSHVILLASMCRDWGSGLPARGACR